MAAYESTGPLPSVFGERVSVLSRLLAGERLLLIAPLRALLTPVPEPARPLFPDPDRAPGRQAGPPADGRPPGPGRLPAGPHGQHPRRDGGPRRGHRRVRARPRAGSAHHPGLRRGQGHPALRSPGPVVHRGGGGDRDHSLPGGELRRGEAAAARAALVSPGIRSRARWSEAVRGCSTIPRRAGQSCTTPCASAGQFSLLDYLGADAAVFLMDEERLAASAAALRKEYLELFRRARAAKRIVPGAAEDPPGFRGAPVPDAPQGGLPDAAPGGPRGGRARAVRVIFELPSDGPRSFFGNFTFFREEMEASLRNGYTVFIFAVYDVQADRLRHILQGPGRQILPQSISAGFALPASRILVVQESEIFGRKRRIPRSVGSARSAAIESFVELSPGDFVVHVNYGIGSVPRHRADQRGGKRAGLHPASSTRTGEKLFIPIEQVNLIQRYIGQEGRQPRLDTPGRQGLAEAEGEGAEGGRGARPAGCWSCTRAARPSPASPSARTRTGRASSRRPSPTRKPRTSSRCIEEVKADMERPVGHGQAGLRGRGLRQDGDRAARGLQGGHGRAGRWRSSPRPRSSWSSTTRPSASASPGSP